MIQVEPNTPNPTHHIRLEDSTGRAAGLIIVDSEGNANPKAITRAPLQRLAMKTTTGNAKYSDAEWPWTPIAQEDWSGGRALDDFDKDSTRFFDAYRANTLFGPIYLGPLETYTTGTRAHSSSLPGSLSFSALIPGSRKYLAVKFTANANFNCTQVALWIRRRGTPKTTLTVELRADAAGNPGTVMQASTVTTSTITDTISRLYHFLIPSQALTSGQVYWIAVYPAASGDDSENYWQVGIKKSAGTTKESAAGSVWSESSIDLYYRATDAGTGPTVRYFRYKYSTYMLQCWDASAPRLWISGDRGQADSNAGDLTKLQDATKGWAVNQWVGCIVQIVAGTGIAEETPYRAITANTATSMTVDTAWKIAHDTSTNYVILGSNTWTELTGHGFASKVFDVMIANNVAYFALGDAVNIRRMQYNDATGLHEYADDGTNKAAYLATVRESTGLQIYRGNNSDATGAKSISKASVVAWNTNLTFGTATTFQDDFGRITGLTEYGSTAALWIFREGTVFYLNATGVPQEIQLREMRTMANSTNGSANMVHNVYLYFTLGYGLERYYNSALDDVGPNRDEGLPSERQGPITCLVGYPGRYFAAIDAGTSGYSSVLMNNGTGWHELYRAPMPGQRIRSIAFEPIPGSTPDRLWVSVGDDVVWLGFPSGTIYPYRDTAMRYTHEGAVVSGWFTASLVDIPKIYNSLKIFSENLAEDVAYIEADYQTDQETTWHPIDGVFDATPSEELILAPEGVGAKRLRLRLRLKSEDSTITPRVKSIVIDTISREDVKYQWTFNTRVVDDDVTLTAEQDDYRTAEEKMALLDEWAEGLVPLVASDIRRVFNNQAIYVNPISLRPYRDKSEGYIATITMVQR
jgi:hypothetical protein